MCHHFNPFCLAAGIPTLQVQRNKDTFRCGNLVFSFVVNSTPASYLSGTMLKWPMPKRKFHVRLIVVCRAMETLFPLFTPLELALAALVAVLAGFVKGVVGFAMPLVFISGLTIFMPPELALAGLILPTLATNAQQAMRQGRQAAVRSIVEFRVFLAVGCLALMVTAQFVRVFPDQVMMAIIGVPVTFFALLQLGGYQITLPAQNRAVEVAAGGVAGALGGFSGILGPPTVAYLTALNLPKLEQMRVQGVIYGVTALALFGAHIGSGVMRAETFWFSLAMVPTAYLGMQAGMAVMDRIDQTSFRRATLFVLLIAGLNLTRRAIWG
jgi:hypothetical protein